MGKGGVPCVWLDGSLDELMAQPLHETYTILAPGFAKWWGSDARALAQAFRRLGHRVLDIDEEDYVPWRWQGVVPKAVRRLFGRVWIDEYNQAVLLQAASSSHDFVLVYKGNLLKPETVRQLRESGKPVFNFYPDVSFQDHGPNIPATLRLYDCVFTTKSYHGDRESQLFGIQRLEHVRHGFDPEVHRPIRLSPTLAKHYECDVSFVGCWSAAKEERILYLLRRSNGLSVKVFGIGWGYASSEFKQRMGRNLREGVFGDELAVVYQASKANLGILSCARSDPTVHDQTTARTFQIPATKSFLLHEDTPEVRSLFDDGEEILLFNSNEDLVDKIELALKAPELREAIRERGHERCQREPYDYSSAARSILRYFEKRANGGLASAGA
jgi:spore maturation protein CgeB